MAFLARNFHDSGASFTPLFRLLDEFDNYHHKSQSNSNGGPFGHLGHHHKTGGRKSTTTFYPKFDVRETDSAFELHGELPGVERDGIKIEFSEPQTLVIRGRTKRAYTSLPPPATVASPMDKNSVNVEGEKPGKGGVETSEHTVALPAVEDSNSNNKPGSGQKEYKEGKAPTAQAKVWLRERPVGEFARTFSFPVRVEEESVSAGLRNGILSVVVPKAKKYEARRVAIN
ncbi:small heat shock protein [Dichotomopilus funicola]|uniref:Small heat shock protein n=1 Tax=Dichotomopilus funicola TaxID=1934379 RepID=A0AAN6V4I4_9PEZI|nr:small heat shock protein [Dichotomopilus funicola]